MSTVIGIHDGHNASAALLHNGRLELALQEERLTRIKNQGDAPAGAASEAWALARTLAGRTADSGAVRVALNGHYMNYDQWQREALVRDYEKSAALPSKLKQPLKNTFIDRVYQRRKAEERAGRLEELGFTRSQLVPVEHHLAHASAAYFTSSYAQRGERALIFTCDGSGDRLSATVSIGNNGQIERIAEISEHDSIGRLYALATRHLGMIPLEHEYKVMGLAPYARNSACDAAKPFLSLFEFVPGKPLVWRRRRGVPSMYAAFGFLQRLLAGQRFDVVAAGVQRFVEEMLAAWVRNAVRETGIRRIACSGGVFMNVKANLAVLELPEVEDMYVFPSCGDESNSIGAACWVAAQAGDRIEPLGPIYFGESITDEEAREALTPAARAGRLRCSLAPKIDSVVAGKLAQGAIVARASGKAEFGARALGNRSILAPAGSSAAVKVLNDAIKCRDFWMPFAPSVLTERAPDYYEKPKPVVSPHMMFAFRSQPARRSAFCAAQHPYDFSVRPQEVCESHNPGYFRLLKEYEALTGEGILLNTSFNLHGEPIVYRARDAVDVFLRSGLEFMALGNWWVEKIAA